MSGRAQLFQEIRQSALTTPEVRPERVAEVRRRLDEGTLVVDPDPIIRALVSQGILE